MGSHNGNLDVLAFQIDCQFGCQRLCATHLERVYAFNYMHLCHQVAWLSGFQNLVVQVEEARDATGRAEFGEYRF